MALTFGTRTQQANPAEDMVTLVRDACLAQGAWELVEDYTTGTVKWTVLRCKASSNLLGQPFYVLLNRSTNAGTTTVYVGLAEGYDTATHSYIRPAMQNASAATPSVNQAYNSTTETYAVSTAQTPGTLWTHALTGNATSYEYWLVPNNNGLTLIFRHSTSTISMVHVEVAESLVDNPAVNDPMPLCIWAGTTSGLNGAVTRAPLATAAQTYLWTLVGSTDWTPRIGTILGTGTNAGNLFQGNKPVGTRVRSRTYHESNNTNSSTAGWARLLYRRVLGFNYAAGVVTGDTITVNGATWLFSAVGNYWFNTAD